MPKFKEGDKVRVLEGQHTGECGEIFGPVSTATVEGFGTNEGVAEIYQVQLDETDEIIRFNGLHLAPK